MNMEDGCDSCFKGERGVSPWAEDVELCGSIETMMQCGCGGYVFHGVYRCKTCGRFFLTAHEDHWPPSSADFFIFEIPGEEARTILGIIESCPDVENRNCSCPAHRESESFHRGTAGVQRWFESEEQSWD
jgi:hypothetical protein